MCPGSRTGKSCCRRTSRGAPASAAPRPTTTPSAAPCPPNLNYPNALNTNPTYDISRQSDEGDGPPHDQGGLLPQPQPEGAEHQPRARRAAVQGRDELLERHEQPAGHADSAMRTPRSASCRTYFQQSKFVEGYYVYNNREWYIQDNWRVNKRLTLDFGLRFVNQQPQHDAYGHSANFFPEKWSLANAPSALPAGVPDGGVGAVSDDASGHEPGHRSVARGRLGDLHRSDRAGHRQPDAGPRSSRASKASRSTATSGPPSATRRVFGAAYDVNGNQKIVLRGGGGVFFDRPTSDSVQNLVSNPPFSTAASRCAAFGSRICRGRAGRADAGDADLRLPVRGRSALVVPVERRCPDGAAVCVDRWTCRTSGSTRGTSSTRPASGAGQNLNTIDLGAAFLPQNQDPTLAADDANGTSALTHRSAPGVSRLRQHQPAAGQLLADLPLDPDVGEPPDVTHGFQAGINWTLGAHRQRHDRVCSRASSTPRTAPCRCATTGRSSSSRTRIRAPRRHIIKANWVWDLPDLARDSTTAHASRAGGAQRLATVGRLHGRLGQPVLASRSATRAADPIVNLTGSPDLPGARSESSVTTWRRLLVEPVQAVQHGGLRGPGRSEHGLESGRNYLTGCGDHTIDLAIARNFRLGGGRTAQIRFDVFNAFNIRRLQRPRHDHAAHEPDQPDARERAVPSRRHRGSRQGATA